MVQGVTVVKNLKMLYPVLLILMMMLSACKDVSYVPPVEGEQATSSMQTPADTGGNPQPPTDTTGGDPQPPVVQKSFTATVSGIWQNDTSGRYIGSMALDNDSNTRWASNDNGDDVWIIIDLQSTKLIAGMAISWQYIGNGYQVEVSLDGVDYTVVREVSYEEADTSRDTQHDFSRNEFGGWWARYVRITPIASDRTKYRSIEEISFTEGNDSVQHN